MGQLRRLNDMDYDNYISQIEEKELIARKQIHVLKHLRNIHGKKCIMTITAYCVKNKYIYWNIICNFPLDTGIYEHHPLRNVEVNKNNDELSDAWGIVADNIVTRSLIAELCKSEKELRNDSGSQSAQQYRLCLASALDSLWD